MAAIHDKDGKCRRIEASHAHPIGVTESCRIVGISEKTLYRWRKEQVESELRDPPRAANVAR